MKVEAIDSSIGSGKKASCNIKGVTNIDRRVVKSHNWLPIIKRLASVSVKGYNLIQEKMVIDSVQCIAHPGACEASIEATDTAYLNGKTIFIILVFAVCAVYAKHESNLCVLTFTWNFCLFKLISGRSSKMVELESSTSKVAQLQIGKSKYFIYCEIDSRLL